MHPFQWLFAVIRGRKGIHHVLLSIRLPLVLLAAMLYFAAGPTAKAASNDAKSVTVWIYHQFPPFIIDAGSETGLSFDLAGALSRISDGRYDFTVEGVSRGRLNHRLAQGEKGIIFWVNPAWFKDAARVKYHWTQDLFLDSNDVISPIDRPVTYAGPASLSHMRLAGVQGHRYPDIEPLLQAEQITREDVASEKQAVMFIAHGRADVSIVASSAARHYANQSDLAGRIHFSPRVFSSFTRSILMQTDDAELVDFVKDAIAASR